MVLRYFGCYSLVLDIRHATEHATLMYGSSSQNVVYATNVLHRSLQDYLKSWLMICKALSCVFEVNMPKQLFKKACDQRKGQIALQCDKHVR